MKRFLNIIFVSTFLISCSNQQEKSQVPSTEQNRTLKDSISTEFAETYLEMTIREPFLVSEIDQLEFTSGGGQSVIDNEYCDTVSNGFFGTYFLIDPDFADERGVPVGGTIEVHASDKMKGWKSNDTTQTIWEINLKSDVISVWDSIHVGLTRTEIDNFNQVNKGICIKKGDIYYSCDFNNFSAVYIFKNDTLKELTVTRECGKRKKLMPTIAKNHNQTNLTVLRFLA
jgi:hypothetical protein